MHVQRLLFAKCFIFSRLLLSLCVSLFFCFVCVVPFSVVSALVGRSPFSALLFDFASLSSSHRVIELVLSCISVQFHLRFLPLLRQLAVKILGSEQQLLWQFRCFILLFSLYMIKC
jgi:hypothetical protein